MKHIFIQQFRFLIPGKKNLLKFCLFVFFSNLITLKEKIYYYGLYESNFFEMSIFGFRDAQAKIPLHNHPNMFGFLKVIKGRVRVSSYSLLDSETDAIIHEKYSNRFLKTQKIIPVKYEGLLFFKFKI